MPLLARRGAMPRILVTAWMALSIAAAGAGAQMPELLLSVDVDLGDYGLADLDGVKRGRVSLVHRPDGPALSVYFLRDGTAPTPPEFSTPDIPSGSVPRGPERSAPTLRALWVWNTDQLLTHNAERVAFLDFVRRRGVDRVFLQLPPAHGRVPRAGFVPFDGALMGPLLAELRSLGALVYALDGDPAYAEQGRHEGVLRTVRRIVEHNRAAPPEQRFHGVRYDIEPYLTRGFQGPRRAEILDGYVTLVARIAEEATAADLAFGVDIPFWLELPDEESGRALSAELDGRQATVLEHVLSQVDDLAIMDYRTQADGPNGAIAHAQAELALAVAAGVGIFVGVETTRLYDEDLYTFRGDGREGLPDTSSGTWVVLERAPEGGTRLWLVRGPHALRSIAERTSGSTLFHWPAGRPAQVLGDRLSYYGLGPELMDAETTRVLGALAEEPAFLGLAFHDYLGLRALLEGR